MDPSTAPRQGNVVSARHRQYLVEEVVSPPAPGDATLVKLVCLDDDAQGRRLDVLWELELGARVVEPETSGLGPSQGLDEPRTFAAYLHALKWNCVTATDARLFQAPFRAGIQLKDYQLTPLQKALELPRANLFIADDVGLGKTIEAGLVLQELLLRQRADFVLIICPATVSLQWRDEMRNRFGIRFEVLNRQWVSRCRQERGFGVNPWKTQSHFIISYQTIRRPEYRDGLLQCLGERARKSLLILDEAHTAAPASASKYAVDSRITKVIRDVAPRFENRLFLSATPHNGHSNSFSSLLELLDPQRFTRGVPIDNRKELEPVMVRRLKSDLRELGYSDFPRRRVVEVELELRDGAWWQRDRLDDDEQPESRVGPGDDTELRLSAMLQAYTLASGAKGRGKLAFVGLQKRLLSSLEAFRRSLRQHAKYLGASNDRAPLISDEDDTDEGIDDETQELLFDEQIAAATEEIVATPSQRTLLTEMLALSERSQSVPDAKALALLQWIRTHQCAAVGTSGNRRNHPWTDRRLLVFTEYADTKRWLLQLLRTEIGGTDQADDRLLQLHGGMTDEGREEVQKAFNHPDHPARILIATDAAREGINLQGQCADLFHFDIPWNPARMEQRNGRIDRVLQAEPEVRCGYFFYAQRPEDMVLKRLVEKVQRIQQELGSLGSVVMDRFNDALESGIDEHTPRKLDRAENLGALGSTAHDELETQRASTDQLRKDIERTREFLSESKRSMDFDPTLLRDALDVGCAMAGTAPLMPAARFADQDGAIQTYVLPPLPASWDETLDSLRPARDRDESPWEWRRRPLLPVVFSPPSHMTGEVAQLHLAHPFVQRILSRFLSQGFSAHDLSRVTVVRQTRDALSRVIAFGRLTLFGPGATRLHDELISVAARWIDGGGPLHLKPFADKADGEAIERLEAMLREAPELRAINTTVQGVLQASAPGVFAQLWPAVRKEGNARKARAVDLLTRRGATESKDLRRIIEGQRAAIEARLDKSKQLLLEFKESEREEREQLEGDRRHMQARLARITQETADEPAEIAASYEVAFARLEPVGLIYLWPSTR